MSGLEHDSGIRVGREVVVVQTKLWRWPVAVAHFVLWHGASGFALESPLLNPAVPQQLRHAGRRCDHGLANVARKTGNSKPTQWLAARICKRCHEQESGPGLSQTWACHHQLESRAALPTHFALRLEPGDLYWAPDLVAP